MQQFILLASRTKSNKLFLLMEFGPPQLPSTSTTCSAPFEHRHEKYTAKMLFAERKFNELKTGKFYQARKAQIENRREAIKKRICPLFLRRKSALDDEYNEKKKKLETVRSLRLRAAERCRAAELSAAQLNLCEMEATVVRQQCEGALERKMEQLEVEMEEVEAILRQNFGHSKRQGADCVSQKGISNGQKSAAEKYLALENEISQGSAANNNKGNNNMHSQMRRWKNVPAMVAQLPSHCVKDDLTKILSS